MKLRKPVVFIVWLSPQLQNGLHVELGASYALG